MPRAGLTAGTMMKRAEVAALGVVAGGLSVVRDQLGKWTSRLELQLYAKQSAADPEIAAWIAKTKDELARGELSFDDEASGAGSGPRSDSPAS